MTLLDFYRALLPEGGDFALFSVPRKKHLWCGSFDKLIELTERVNVEHSWYFALASFSSWERKQSAVRAKRCFYFDIDCGPEKFAKHPESAYETQKAGLAALLQFSAAVDLKPSLIVSSGAGLHAYYALTEDVTPEQWRPVAVGLGKLAQHYGLKADPACTTDSARVLRPLGALHKNGQRVTLLKDTGVRWSLAALQEIVGALPEPELPATPGRARLNVNDDLTLWEPTPSSALKAASKCAALNRIAVLKGDVPEPEWRAMLGIVKFSTEGADLAHEWSNGYDGYSYDETQRKFDRYEGTGPTLCSSFERFNRAACDACPHRGKVSTPLSLGRLTDQQVEKLPEDKKPKVEAAPVPKSFPIQLPSLGRDYKIEEVEIGQGDKAKKVYKLMYRAAVEQDGEDGKTTLYKWEPLSNDVFWLETWTGAGRDESDGAMVGLRLLKDGRLIAYDMPTKLLGSKQNLLQFLTDKGITTCSVTAAATQRMHDYMNQQFNQVKEIASRFVVRNRFGVQYQTEDKDSKLMCAHGRYVIFPDGRIEEAMLGAKLKGYRNLFTIAALPYSPAGRWEPSVWKEHVIPAAKKQAEFYRLYYTKPGYEVAQLAIMLSIASPLLLFVADGAFVPGEQLPAAGLTVSLYSSGSGKGKTSMQKAAAAAFGNPENVVLSAANQDATANYQSGFSAALGTMPFFGDEVTGNTAQDVGAMINRLANGTDRRRADRNGNPRDAHTWALIGSVSTNIPQREMLAAYQKSSDALQMRLLELTCDFPDLTEGEQLAYKAKLEELMTPNHGAVGALLHLLIVQKGNAWVRDVMQKRYAEAVGIVPGATQRQRFLQRGMACALGAFDLLKALGVEFFDRNTLIQQYAAAARAAQDYAATVSRSPLEMVRKMISDMAPNIISTSAEAPQFGRMLTIENQSSLKTPWVGRRINEARYVYVLVQAMKDWARENGFSYVEIINELKRQELLRPLNLRADLVGNITITKGTTLGTVQGQAVKIDEARLFTEDQDGAIPQNVVQMPARGVVTTENRNESAHQDRTGN
jgi:hypothetical protein